jgi:cathepsin D
MFYLRICHVSDLWLAGSSCTNCDGITTFSPSSSSSFQNLGTDFKITYGSGFAEGTMGQDIIQMAGFSVQNQQFAVCDTIAQDLINQPVSGLMGMAFQSIATSGATPFWQSLVAGGAWDSPVMAFQFTRFVCCISI